MKRLMVLLVVLLAVAGCGDDGDVTTGAVTTIPPATASDEASPAESLVPEVVPAEGVAPEPVATVQPLTAIPVTADSLRTVTVGGIGHLEAAPSTCVVNLGVRVERPTVAEAAVAAEQVTTAITDAMRGVGVDPSAIQTAEFYIQPVYSSYPWVTGYEVRHGYRVTLADVALMEPMLSAAIDAGGNEVTAGSLWFGVDQAALLADARALAWSDARGRAADLARLAGVTLGALVDLDEDVFTTSNQGPMLGGGGGGDDGTSDSFHPGTTGLTVMLTATYSISG